MRLDPRAAAHATPLCDLRDDAAREAATCAPAPGREPLARYGGGWPARLSASVARRGARSHVVAVSHSGPLRLQKCLWPEGGDPVHLILLHPPGGIAAGDTLSIDLSVATDAHALVTTPGAGKWYAADARSTQSVRLAVDAGASLEWLPQETIVHDGANADARTDVELDASATAIGQEIVVLGRRASGERFARGVFDQRLTIRRGARLLYDDVAHVQGGDALRASAVLGDAHVSALLWLVSPTAFDEDAAMRAETAMADAQPGLYGASCVEENLLVARVVGDSPERARRALAAVWAAFRPPLFGRAARAPRIWMT